MINAVSLRSIPLLKAVPRFGHLNNTLIVQGHGLVEKTPDTMTMNVAINESNSKKNSRAQVFQSLAQKAKQLMDAIKALPFVLKTEPSFFVSQQFRYDQNKGTNVADGFTGSYSLKLTDSGDDPNVFAEHAAKITEVAEKYATNVAGPGFNLSPAKYQQALQEANVEGYKNAKASAEAIVKNETFKIADKPLEIKVGNVSENQTFYRGAKSFALSASPEATSAISSDIFDYKPIQVQSNPIQVTFEIV